MSPTEKSDQVQSNKIYFIDKSYLSPMTIISPIYKSYLSPCNSKNPPSTNPACPLFDPLFWTAHDRPQSMSIKTDIFRDSHKHWSHFFVAHLSYVMDFIFFEMFSDLRGSSLPSSSSEEEYLLGPDVTRPCQSCLKQKPLSFTYFCLIWPFLQSHTYVTVNLSAHILASVITHNLYFIP